MKLKNNKKNIIKTIVVIIFLIFISITLTLSDRNYVFFEKITKDISSSVNSFFINKLYSTKKMDEKVVEEKIVSLKNENDELRKLLELKTKKESYVAASITNHNLKYWFNKIMINKGEKQKVKKGAPVINNNGLIGFVSNVSNNTSEVELLTSVDSKNMFPVIINTNGESVLGVIDDYDSKTGLLKVGGITTQANIEKDASVVLSGYDNEAYRGIYVGKVEKTETTNYGLSKMVWVKPSVNYNDLLFVMVVTDK